MTYSKTITDAMENTYRSSLLADAFLRIKNEELQAKGPDIPMDLSQIANILADYTADICSENRGQIFPLWERTVKLLNIRESRYIKSVHEQAATIVYAFHKHGVDDLRETMINLAGIASPISGAITGKKPYTKILALYAVIEKDSISTDIIVRLVDITESLTKLNTEELQMYVN